MLYHMIPHRGHLPSTKGLQDEIIILSKFRPLSNLVPAYLASVCKRASMGKGFGRVEHGDSNEYALGSFGFNQRAPGPSKVRHFQCILGPIFSIKLGKV